MNLFQVENIELFLVILPIVSFLYASVGHGGASGYLAMMALFSFNIATMKPTALLLNLFVAGIAFIHFYKAGFFNKKLFLIFAVASIPFAFLGGIIEVDPSIYKKILAVLLIFAVLKMLNVFSVLRLRSATEKKNQTFRSTEGNNRTLSGVEMPDSDANTSTPLHKHENSVVDPVEGREKFNIKKGLTIGGGIGFLSGLIGIGGGIILSPVILLLKWGTVKEAATVSALFIWVNSAAGLAGQFTNGVKLTNDTFILVGIALIGGFAGGYYGSKKWDNKILRGVLSTVLVMACFKLFFV